MFGISYLCELLGGAGLSSRPFVNSSLVTWSTLGCNLFKDIVETVALINKAPFLAVLTFSWHLCFNEFKSVYYVQFFLWLDFVMKLVRNVDWLASP
ncbi:hypothetical protein QUC31_012152 [Theobroma cacao]